MTTKTKQTEFDSKSGVIPKRTHGKGIWGGERKVVNIRIDSNLYKATKPLLIRYFGSVCAAIEPYLASIYSVTTTNNFSEKNGVIPSITVDIGNLNITRHMKPRRKMVVDVNGDNNGFDFGKCYVDGCGHVAVGKAVYVSTGMDYFVCQFHLDNYRKDSKWTVEASP